MQIKSFYALGRKKSGDMNRLESEYDSYLSGLLRSGEILWYRFEGIKLRLADNTFYTPDFIVMDSSGIIEIHETKGFMMDDANVKIKVANEQFPFKFFLIKKQAKKNGGGWCVKEY